MCFHLTARLCSELKLRKVCIRSIVSLLHNGWKAILENKGEESYKPAIGVIGSIKNFVLSRLPEVNSLIETEVVIITEIFNASVLEAKVRSAGKMIAQCELKIFIQE